MQVITQSPELDNALVDASNWADEKWVHELGFARTRRYNSCPLRDLNRFGMSPATTTLKKLKAISRSSLTTHARL